MHKVKLFRQANGLLRENHVLEAINIYELLLQNTTGISAKQIQSNLNLARDRLTKRSVFETEFLTQKFVTSQSLGLDQHQIRIWTPTIEFVDPKEIKIPFYENPLVSILIPVYGKLEYTLSCLKSISNNLPKVSFEVIILDDRSPDRSARTLKKIKNVRVFENQQNLGFIGSCNNGVSLANGKYLFFLNNDTVVLPGWLDELLKTFENFPNCGLAGSKLIYPNGLLQEAGAIVWKDGSVWNYGKGDNPSRPEYNYAREVDYCSGAAILLPKKLFIDLGGFDKRYSPAYCEDADLGFTVRAAGYSVIYQPLSQVIHFEGATSGRDENSGTKMYQKINLGKFYEKWATKLKKHQPNGVEPWLERDRNPSGRILFIDACTPTPDQDSGSIDTLNLMLMFRSLGYLVTFIPQDNFTFMEGYTQDLQRCGIYTIYRPYTKSLEEHCLDYQDNYDVVMIFRAEIASRCIETINTFLKRAKVIFNTVDLHFLRLEREAYLFHDPKKMKESVRFKKLELDLMKKVDISTVVSTHEYELLTKEEKDLKIFKLPFSRKVAKEIRPFKDRDGVFFVGGFQHAPNVDAIKYFCNDIWPKVTLILPQARLNIVGSRCPDEIYSLASDSVIVHGYVKNLENMIQSMKVNIVPLRFGAGTKGKLASAMVNGLPSVSTKVGVEGMDILNEDSGVYIEDDPNKFAQKIVDLYSNEDSWNKFSVSAIKFSNHKFGPLALHKNLKELFFKIGIDIPLFIQTKIY